MDLEKIYDNRFSAAEQRQKRKLWSDLYSGFFVKYIHPDDIVLDLAAGYCEFINAVASDPKARGRYIAVDMNPDTRIHADAGIEFVQSDAANLEFLNDNEIDIVFVSNFFEHIRDKDNILIILQEINRVLKVGGKLLILQPNIHYIGTAYWDYFDHFTPLTEKSMAEALDLAGGYGIVTLISRFIPYTTKSRLRHFAFLVRLYLKLPFVWLFFGKQMFVVAKKVKSHD